MHISLKRLIPTNLSRNVPRALTGLALLLIFTCLSFGAVAQTTELWISQAAGTNQITTAGTQADPFKSITFALNVFADRGVPNPWRVHIEAGTYDADSAKPVDQQEQFPIVMRQGMTLQGEDGVDMVIISGAFSQGTTPLVTSSAVTGLTFKDITFGDSAPDLGIGGGALQLVDATGLIEGCVFKDNTVSGFGAPGGGLGLSVFAGGAFTITGNSFIGNSANGDGGGFYVLGDMITNVTGNTFSGNVASSEGGGFYVSGSMTENVTGNFFDGNRADGGNGVGGGGLRIFGAMTGDVTGNTFRGNSGFNGGGFRVDTMTGNVTDNTFSENFASREGGGFWASALTGDVLDNIFSGNDSPASTVGNGGGYCIDISHIGNTIRNSFSANTAGNVGGGFAVIGVFAGEISRNAFSVNSAAEAGGGLYLNSDGGDPATAVVSNNIFVGNFIPGSNVSRGGAFQTRQSVTLVNNTFKGVPDDSTVTIQSFAPATIIQNNIFLGGLTAIWEEGAPVLTTTNNDFFDVVNILVRDNTAFMTDLVTIELTVPGFSNNHDWDPALVGDDVATRLWTAPSVFDNVTNETTLTDGVQNWTPGEFSGSLVQLIDLAGPGPSFIVVTNTATELIVQGNLGVTALVPVAGDYTINDSHLAISSQNIDAGTDTGLTSDFEGGFRPVPLGGSYDIGADEFGEAIPDLTVTPAGRAVSSLAGTTSFDVSNTGGGTFDWTADVLPDADWLTISSGGSGTDTGTINVSFNENLDVSARMGTIRVTAIGVLNSPVDVTVSQEAAPVTPVLSVSPGMLDFGSVEIGQSSQLSFVVSNIGTGTLSGVASVPSGPFSIDPASASYSLGAGQSQMVTATFSPTTAGSVADTVSFTGAGGAMATAMGVGTEPEVPVLSVSPGVLDFGSVEVGQSSQLSFIVSNTGTGTLNGMASVPSGPFNIDAFSASYSLGAGQSQMVTVTFSPTTAGSAADTVSFTGAGGAMATVMGVGTEPEVPVLSVSPLTLDLGSVLLGQQTQMNFVVENIGTGTLVGAASVPSGPFSIDAATSNYSLTANQMQAVTVLFLPDAAGTFMDTVSFTGAGGTTAAVSGTGLLTEMPELLASPFVVDFGSVVVNATRVMEIRVQNVGTGTLEGSAGAMSPFSIISGSPYSLGEGASSIVRVRYAPTLVQPDDGTASFTGGLGQDVMLAGNGATGLGSISGMVTTDTARPQLCAAILATSGSLQYATAADLGGLYRFDDLPEGIYTLDVFSPSFEIASIGTMVVHGEETVVDIQLVRRGGSAGTISGTVSERASNGSLVAVLVEVFNEMGQSLGSAITCAGGDYEIELPSEKAPLRISASISGYLTGSQNVDFDPNTGGSVDLTLDLVSGDSGMLSGVITDLSSGDPVASARVTATGPFGGRSTTTNNDGEFTLSNLVTGYYTVRASASDYESMSQTVTVFAGSPTTGIQIDLSFRTGPATGCSALYTRHEGGNRWGDWLLVIGSAVLLMLSPKLRRRTRGVYTHEG